MKTGISSTIAIYNKESTISSVCRCQDYCSTSTLGGNTQLVLINKHLIDFKKKLTFITWVPTFVGDLLEREGRLR